MSRYPSRLVRPLLFLAVLLLLLSAVVPWSWRPLASGPTPTGKIPISAEQSDVPHQLARASVLCRPAPAAKAEPVVTTTPSAPTTNWEPEAPSFTTASRPLLQLADASAETAPIEPRVAELISLDPSLAELEPSRLTTVRRPSLADESVDDSTLDLDTPLPTPPARSVLPTEPMLDGAWPTPSSLLEELKELREEFPTSSAWVENVEAELDRLAKLHSFASEQSEPILERLHQLAEEIRQQSVRQTASRERTLRLRCGYSLLRRLIVWDAIANLNGSFPTAAPAHVDRAALSSALHDMQNLLTTLPSGPAWQEYLRIRELIALLQSRTALSAKQRALARDVLTRLDSPRLNADQFVFASQPEFKQLMESLLPVVQEPVSWREFLEVLEAHEAADTSLAAVRASEQIQIMRWSHSDEVRHLARVLNDNYRNANVRVAITEELINRFMPAPQATVEPVVDNIRGADVAGQSQSVARLRIVLLPDKLRWRLGLEAKGSVTSETESSKGPARFWNDGLGHFRARKLVTVDRRGMNFAHTEAHASAENYLRDFETNFDNIPLFGSIARSIARQQYEKEQPLARYEIEDKISQRASSRMDREVEERLRQAERDFQTKLLLPLDRLNLEPTPVEMQTTAERLICRYRLAGPKQLSAHTPRPQAPSDSLLSLQIHQSLFNNALENLRLDGRTVELRKLYVEMLERFETPDIKIPDDLPENVEVSFADHDAVRIACEDGRVKLTIRLKELSHEGETRWKNFEVHGYYKPSDNQLEANLVRDGNLELMGERLRLADQVALRGIFAKVLSRNRTLALVNKQLLLRKELTDLQVTQFVIQDGWIGVALGPKGTGFQPPAPIRASEEVSRRPIRGLIQRVH